MEPILKKAIAQYIYGSLTEITFVGDPIFISLLKEATESSKNLMLALREGNLDKVNIALQNKREAVLRYEKVTGNPWGL